MFPPLVLGKIIFVDGLSASIHDTWHQNCLLVQSHLVSHRKLLHCCRCNLAEQTLASATSLFHAGLNLKGCNLNKAKAEMIFPHTFHPPVCDVEIHTPPLPLAVEGIYPAQPSTIPCRG